MVNALVIQTGDGKILTGGSFSSVDGTYINALARLNTDGSLESSFEPGFAIGDTVQALAVQPDDDNVLVAALIGDDNAASVEGGIGGRTRNLAIGPLAESHIHNVLHRCLQDNGQFDPAFDATTVDTKLALFGLPAA